MENGRIKLVTKLVTSALVMFTLAGIFLSIFEIGITHRSAERRATQINFLISITAERNAFSRYILSPTPELHTAWKGSVAQIEFLLSRVISGESELSQIGRQMQFDLDSLELKFSQPLSEPLTDISARAKILQDRESIFNNSVAIVNALSADSDREEYALVLLCLLFGAVPIAFLWLVFLKAVPKRILKPIAAIQQAVKFVGRGDFSHRIEVDSPNELGDLAKAFNSMIQELEESYAALKSKTEDLEKRNEEMLQMNRLMVGRELKMAELKREIEEKNNEKAQ